MNICKVEGCGKKVLAHGLCSRHYTQVRKKGKIDKRTRRDLNEIIVYTDHAEILLYDNDCNVIGKCLIDVDDVDKVKCYKWSRSDLQRSTYYCVAYGREKHIRLHRYLMDVDDPNIMIDHINHNGLDNRKSNLRICTCSQNLCNALLPKNNKSGHKGVYFAKDKNKWTAQISINHKAKYLGRFKNIDDAVKARKEAEALYYGEFANAY